MSNRRPSPDPVYTLRGSTTSISCLKFQTSNVLLSGNGDGEVHAWSMTTRRVLTTTLAHPGYSVLWVDCVDDSHRLTQGRDGTLRIWSAAKDSEWTHTDTIKTSSMGFCKGCLLSRKIVAVPSDLHSQVDLCDLDTIKVIASLKMDSSSKEFGMCMAIKPVVSASDETKLLIGYEDGSVALWDTRQNKMVDSKKLHEDSVMCMDYSSILRKGYSGSVNEKLHSWTLSDDQITTTDILDITNPGFSDVTIRNDGKIVVSAGWDGKVRIFSGKRLKPLAVLDYHKASVHCVTFSDDNMLACGSKDQHITLWDIYR